MPEAQHPILGERLQRHADEREEIGDGDGPAFFLGCWAALDQGVHGNNEEAARSAEEREQDRDGDEVQARACEERGHDHDADHAGENHAVLDFACGGVACQEAADSDAQAERGEQVAAVLVVYS